MNDIVFPEGTVDLRRELVPIIKQLVRRGLPADFVNNCVHVGGFQPFGGGIKSDLVGGLKIDVNAAIKLEDKELDRHKLIMEAVNNRWLKVFPGVLAVEHLDDDRALMLMEQLLGFETLLESVYLRDTNLTDIDNLVDKTFVALKAIWREGKRSRAHLTDIRPWRETLVSALRRKLGKVFAEDPELEMIMDHPGTVMHSSCPPVPTLLDEVEEWLSALTDIPEALCHGDFHWKNIMSRKTGRGTSLRFIDPKPSVGYADPVVDLGMLYHWAEELGWAQVDAKKHCRSKFEAGRSGADWLLNASTENTSAAAEERRQRTQKAIDDNLERSRNSLGPEWEGRLLLSRALAHAGLAAVSRGDEGKTVRRFALGFCLKVLAEWDRLHKRKH